MREENSSEGIGPVRDPLLEKLDLTTIADERSKNDGLPHGTSPQAVNNCRN